MKNFLSVIAIFLAANTYLSAQNTELYLRWNTTDSLIMINKISKENAIDSIKLYVSSAIQDFKSLNITITDRNDWVFPMKGWTKVEYRSGGKDYKAERFDYFQGGESINHPAHDIFILDNDSNGVEDITGQKVTAVAMATGIVFTEYSGFKRGDFIRGGNYVKIFDPETQGMFYYSHLDSVFVHTGQLVKAGDSVGFVGRTGRKAITGKTHLHIAYYKIFEGYPRPKDILDDLYKAQGRLNN